MAKPFILLTGMRETKPSRVPGMPLQAASVTDDYARGVERAGGLPLLVPYLEDMDHVKELVELSDGLLLTGGEDVAPEVYQEEPRHELGDLSPDRDRLEMTLIQAMHQKGKPIFGICRGMQMLNAVLGGTLYQDLRLEWEGNIQHAQRAPRNFLSHQVNLKDGSQIRSALGEVSELRVNSFHHQAVRKLAPGFQAVAFDPEGLVEAMESDNQETLMFAVQWHPENLWRDYPVFLGLFRLLVDAAAERKTKF
ncbi:gamma-glutamyl-gamma-aminobutyrate hydrolase family protein [Alicyclobacillus tolerans]|uniref:Glutamine amidotransferase n=1 Tax=Alicyclobacillus tolerans TaxID=90970 RepID=A0ABT9LTS8_9BACL|nr:gamma-glutamyl-gamma-aminobutyrate hydrolase family protein [Alicyclobacillus tengchongensis]MDP9727670.1 putative glutamine amidotransferase [Alicyclobacillus tengchongensis]